MAGRYRRRSRVSASNGIGRASHSAVLRRSRSNDRVIPTSENGMQRYGMGIGIKPEMIAAYKQLHAAVWPAVLAQMARSHIRNYTISLREPDIPLLIHSALHVHCFAADMAARARD